MLSRREEMEVSGVPDLVIEQETQGDSISTGYYTVTLVAELSHRKL